MAQWGYYRQRARGLYPNGKLRVIDEQWGVKQKHPMIRSLPLYYWAHKYVQTGYEPTGWWRESPNQSGADSSVFWDTAFTMLPEYEIAYNKARRKFLDSVSARAQLGATAAEYKSSLDMIANRSMQLFQAFSSLKKGRFHDSMNYLGVKRKKKHQNKFWNKPNQAGSLWLEYWFGWAPLIGDIHTAIEVLQQPVPDGVIKATSGSTASRRTASENSASIYWSAGFTAQCIFKLQSKVRIENPNEWEANRLGLVNPATVIWELVPFSFIVDWFIPVERFLEGYSDIQGLSFDQPFVTRFIRAEADNFYLGNRNHPSQIYGKKETAKAYQVYREPGGFRHPYLTATLPTRLSVTRALTSVSLLIGIFAPKK